MATGCFTMRAFYNEALDIMLYIIIGESMKKLIGFKLNSDVQELLNGVVRNENGEGFFNPLHISQLFFETNEIYFTLGNSNTGAHVNFKFSNAGMGEYHRMKRELEEVFS